MMGEKQKISLRIDEDLLKNLDNLIIGDKYQTQTSKFEALINIASKNYVSKAKELEGYFEYLEMAYICQAFNGTIISYDLMPTKLMLKVQIEEFYEFGSMGFFTDQELDIPNIINKIDKLDAYQAWFVINSVQSFWDSQLTDTRAKIDELFLVSK